MDDRVQQCPNCGSAVLASARFCVTCGIRLPDSPGGSGATGDPAASGWAQPAEEDVWIGEAPALDDESEQRLADDFQDAQPPAASNAGSPDAGDGQPEETDADAPVDSVIALPPADAGEQPAVASPESNDDADPPPHINGPEETPLQFDLVSTETALPADEADAPAHFDHEPGSEQDVDTTEQPVTPVEERETEQIGPEGELADLASTGTGGDGQANGDTARHVDEPETTELALGGDQDDVEDDPDDFEPAGWDESPSSDRAMESGQDEADGVDEALESIAELTTAPTSATRPGQEAGDPVANLDRATALLEELHELLPQLAAPVASPKSSVDLASLRDHALTARGDRSFDDFAALREVISDAVSRPRDIEVVLRLSQRIEDIAALLQERDRLDSAFNELIERMDS